MGATNKHSNLGNEPFSRSKTLNAKGQRGKELKEKKAKKAFAFFASLRSLRLICSFFKPLRLGAIRA
jgi:hypothetical protein